MRRQVYDLLEKLKYCSPLGSLVRGVRGSLITRRGPTLGVGTIRKLEAAGVLKLQKVADMDFDALIAAGIQRRLAELIRAYVRPA